MSLDGVVLSLSTFNSVSIAAKISCVCAQVFVASDDQADQTRYDSL